jgi:ribonuclease HI
MVIYTDGSKKPKPNRGGIGVVFVWTNADGHEEEFVHSPPGFRGTNAPQMELKAAIEALRLLLRGVPVDRSAYNKVLIYADASYLVNYHPLARSVWPREGWRKRDGSPVSNPELWKELTNLERRLGKPLKIEKVKGHGTNVFNRKADEAARRSAEAATQPALTPAVLRAKRSTKRPARDGLPLQGMEVEIHVHHARFVRVQRMNRYDFSVQAPGPHFEEVATAYGREEIPIRAGHSYLVRFSSEVSYLLVDEVVAAID